MRWPLQKLRAELQTDSLSDQVYKLLRRQIASGKLRPGGRILEQDLARALRISRTPVREALLRLEAERLVICNSRRSYNVRTLTVADVKNTYEIVGILEAAAVAQAAPRMTPEDLGHLEEFNQRMEHAANKGNLPAFGRWNRRFHDVFLGKVENRALVEVCGMIRGQLYTFPVRRSSLARWLRKSVEEHKKIIRLAAAQDARGLADYFRNVHWSAERNLKFIEDAFERDGHAAMHF